MADLVWKHPCGGELFQGDRDDARAAACRPLRFHTLVLAAVEVPHPDPFPDELNGLAIPLDDAPFRDARAARTVKRAAGQVADFCASQIRAGRRVLVTCAAGLNRSGLISGLTLRALGVGGESALRKIRRARGAFALSNRDFAAVVRA